MINEKEIKTLFKIYPVLSGVHQELLAQALSNASLVTVKEGAQIFDELQVCNAFPFILSGKIRVYKQSVNGREMNLARFAR